MNFPHPASIHSSRVGQVRYIWEVMVDGKIHRPGTFQPGVCVPPGLDDGDMVTSDYIINLHVKR